MKFDFDKIEGFFQNKYVLYVILFFSVVNILGYLVLNDFGSITLFILVGLLTSYFNKNMAIILACSLLITNLMVSRNYLNKAQESKNTKEGFEIKLKNVIKESENAPIEPKKSVFDDDDNYEPLNTSNTKKRTKKVQEGLKNMNKDVDKVKEKFEQNKKELLEKFKVISPYLNKAKEILDNLSK